MQNHDPIEEVEKALLRLVPTALSQRATEEIESVINDLSLGESRPNKSILRWVVASGLAACLVLAVFLSISVFQSERPIDSLAGVPAKEASPVMSLLSETKRVEEVTDQGLFTDLGGSAVRQVRVRVVEETSMRDEETGIVFQLSAPREEVHLVPVSTF